MRLSSSMGAAEAEELASGRFDLDVLSPATRAAAESSTTRPSRINCLRVAGIRRSRNSSLFRDINPKLSKSCGKNLSPQRTQRNTEESWIIHPKMASARENAGLHKVEE